MLYADIKKCPECLNDHFNTNSDLCSRCENEQVSRDQKIIEAFYLLSANADQALKLITRERRLALCNKLVVKS